MLLLSSVDFFFFKINFFKRFYQEHYQSVKQFGSRSGPAFDWLDLGPNSLFGVKNCIQLRTFFNIGPHISCDWFTENTFQTKCLQNEIKMNKTKNNLLSIDILIVCFFRWDSTVQSALLDPPQQLPLLLTEPTKLTISCISISKSRMKNVTSIRIS